MHKAVSVSCCREFHKMVSVSCYTECHACGSLIHTWPGATRFGTCRQHQLSVLCHITAFCEALGDPVWHGRNELLWRGVLCREPRQSSTECSKRICPQLLLAQVRCGVNPRGLSPRQGPGSQMRLPDIWTPGLTSRRSPGRKKVTQTRQIYSIHII